MSRYCLGKATIMDKSECETIKSNSKGKDFKKFKCICIRMVDFYAEHGD